MKRRRGERERDATKTGTCARPKTTTTTTPHTPHTYPPTRQLLVNDLTNHVAWNTGVERTMGRLLPSMMVHTCSYIHQQMDEHTHTLNPAQSSYTKTTLFYGRQSEIQEAFRKREKPACNNFVSDGNSMTEQYGHDGPPFLHVQALVRLALVLGGSISDASRCSVT